ncbi:(2Fe-2S) ferredoxin domain-containing protein [Thiospirochaeta perfilievii]|uniref:(2Fe-2S) ferredoxin domain-containing protein n=1 Tax=Thiospirochaeta perfilievii TaxID=252967 RepID=A0A5C1Q9L2_9SPIO|nr:(2Fe-2S) ferredoxin domain-containing protein [Thiospirochaeta perfilievii]QEN04171.1 (2Fe-2S) ferredoxin domain-containing protein [Thiospirochaeta perfilievii]
MAKMTLAQLKALRDDKKKEINRRDTDAHDVTIIVGMGTCGIAAGAKDAMSALIDEIKEHELDNVTIKQTGCMGLCHSEPTVDIKAPGMPQTIYGNVDGDIAREIIVKHVIGKELISKYVLDRPASDIMKEQN